MEPTIHLLPTARRHSLLQLGSQVIKLFSSFVHLHSDDWWHFASLVIIPLQRTPTWSRSSMIAPWHSQPRSPTNGGGGGNVYIPHPAPNAAGNEESSSKMGSTLSLLKVSPLLRSLSLLTFPRHSLSLRSFPSSSTLRFLTFLFLYGNDIEADTAITFL